MRKLILACCIWAFSAGAGLAATSEAISVAPATSDVEGGSAIPKDRSPKLKPETEKTLTSYPSKYEPMNSWPVVVTTLFALVLCIFLLAWFARRFNGFNVVRNKDMHVVATLSVGAREKLSLVNVRGQTLLLGVTSQQISCLHTFDADYSVSQEDDIGQAHKPDFSATLKGLLNKHSPVEDKNPQAFSSKAGKQ